MQPNRNRRGRMSLLGGTLCLLLRDTGPHGRWLWFQPLCANNYLSIAHVHEQHWIVGAVMVGVSLHFECTVCEHVNEMRDFLGYARVSSSGQVRHESSYHMHEIFGGGDGPHCKKHVCTACWGSGGIMRERRNKCTYAAPSECASEEVSW